MRRIQRTPALKYIGAILGREREPAETKHRCCHPGMVPPSLKNQDGKAALSPAWGPIPHSCLKGVLRAAPALLHVYVSGPSPVPMPRLCPRQSSVRQSHVGTPKEPEGALSFPKVHYVPKCKAPGVSMYWQRYYQAGRGVYLSKDDALYPIK